MNKPSKIDFIIDLLGNKKLDTRNKERILSLTASEIKTFENKEVEILERITNIENKLNKPLSIPIPNPSIQPNPISDLPEYISPSGLTEFLNEYNQHPILKYTCHEIFDQETITEINIACDNQEYIFSDHQKVIKIAFNTLTKKYLISKNIFTLIKCYLDGGGNWSSEKFKINWKSEQLITWANQNKGLVPNPGDTLRNKLKYNGFEIDEPILPKLTGKRIMFFSDLVIHFKNLFHIKFDNSLKYLISRSNDLNDFNEIIDFEIEPTSFSENIEFFADVDKLIQAYQSIIKITIECSTKNNNGKPHIRLSLKETKEGQVIFGIHHKNSVYQKSIVNTINRIGESQSNLIKHLINGVCDLFIKADFGNGQYAEINLWNGNERKAVKIDQFDGVEYLLIFNV